MRRGAEILTATFMLASLMAFSPAQEPTTEQRADEALQTGDHVTAIALYREVIAAEPQNLGAKFGLGQALYFAGRIEEGIPLLETVRDASGGAGIVLYVLGQAYLELDRFADAEVALAGAAAGRPDVVPLAFLRAELCYRMGRGAATARRLDEVMELAPQWDVPYLRLGALRLDERRYSDAATALERALALQPANADAALLLAVAYSRIELPEKGLAVLEGATKAAPESTTLLLALAERYDRLGRVDQLEAMAERILEFVPGHPIAELMLAQRASLTGHLETALAHAQRAAANFGDAQRDIAGVRPADRWVLANKLLPLSWRLVADLQRRLGRVQAARAGAEALVAEFPLYPEGHFLLGNMLLRERDTAGRGHLQEFKRLTDARVHTDLATNSLLTKNSEQAVGEFGAARDLAPEDPLILIGLAEASRRAGDAGAAIALLEEARTMGADPTSWYANYVLALGALDRREEALAAWTEAVQLGLELDYEVLAYVHSEVDACRD